MIKLIWGAFAAASAAGGVLALSAGMWPVAAICGVACAWCLLVALAPGRGE